MPNETSFDWDRLLERIAAGRVIPILGPELLLLQHEGREISLSQYLAERLALGFKIPISELSEDKQRLFEEDPFHYVVDRTLETGRDRHDLDLSIREILKRTPLATPKPLRKLARIQPFNLFVSVTFDSLLAQALNEERFGGTATTEVLAFAPNEPKDLARKRSSEHPTVYHLLGRMSASLPYVVTEEDALEFFYSLSEKENRPKRLFDELCHNDLLIIGCSFPDWLGRFFMRIAKGERLSNRRDCFEFLADRKLDREGDFVLFLQNFSRSTQLYRKGGAVAFVDELLDLYERSPKAVCLQPVVERKQPHVFISYASEDRVAAEKIRSALQDAKLNVWFDKEKLEGGDEYEKKIQRAIRDGALFLPLISANTEGDGRSFFRKEWGWALSQAQYFIGSSLVFVVPVTIDTTDAQTATQVPDEFTNFQWLQLPGGETTTGFVDLIKGHVREFIKRGKGRV